MFVQRSWCGSKDVSQNKVEICIVDVIDRYTNATAVFISHGHELLNLGEAIN